MARLACALEPVVMAMDSANVVVQCVPYLAEQARRRCHASASTHGGVIRAADEYNILRTLAGDLQTPAILNRLPSWPDVYLTPTQTHRPGNASLLLLSSADLGGLA